MSTPSSRPGLLRFLTALVWAVALVVFCYSWGRNALLEFDESNTLRIAAMGVADILRILSIEQNFPPYYLMMHFLGSVVAVKAFNVACYIATLLLGRRILAYFFEAAASKKVLWLLFTTVPYLCRHGFHLRMYGLTSLVITGQVYLLLRLRFEGRESPRWLGALGALGASLHVLGIVSGVAAVVARYWIAPLGRRRLLGLLAGPLVACLAQLMLKADPVRAYWSVGVNYVEVLNIGLAGRSVGFWLNSVYFFAVDFWATYFFVALLVFTALHLVREGRFRSPEYFALLAMSSGMVAIPIALPHGFSEHHAAFFVAPFALLLFISTARSLADDPAEVLVMATAISAVVAVELWRHPWTGQVVTATFRQGCYLGFGIGVVVAVLMARTGRGQVVGRRLRSPLARALGAAFLVAHFWIVWDYTKEVRRFDESCAAASASLSRWAERSHGGLLFLAFLHHNLARASIPQSHPIRIVIAGPGGTLDATPLDDLAVLEDHARRGGMMFSSEANRDYLGKDPGVAALVARHRPVEVAFYFPVNTCDWGRSLDDLGLVGYRFSRCEKPGIFYYVVDE